MPLFLSVDPDTISITGRFNFSTLNMGPPSNHYTVAHCTTVDTFSSFSLSALGHVIYYDQVPAGNSLPYAVAMTTEMETSD